MTAYIDATDVLAAMPRSSRPDPNSASAEDVEKIARLDSLCLSTSEMIDAELGWDLHRHPDPAYEADPTVTWIVDGRGRKTIHLHAGVVSLETVEYRYGNGTWTALEDEDFELFAMYDQEGERPFDHLRRVVGKWPSGDRNIRLTGVRGWDEPPARLLELNVAWVRQHVAAGDSYSGAIQVPDGQFVPTPRLSLPDDVRMFLTRERDRFKECWT